MGPESTGKTTLARQLAAHYNTVYVPEYMRTYFEKEVVRIPFQSKLEDILPIAEGQIKSENLALQTANELLFCDTNLLEIACYSSYYFGEIPELLMNSLENMHYDLYFLTYIDVPWQKDDLRDRPKDREKLFSIFRESLRERDIPHLVLCGNEPERLQIAIQEIEKHRKKLHGI